MTLEEKLGQLQQLDGEANGNFRPEHLQNGAAGSAGFNLERARRPKNKSASTNRSDGIAAEDSTYLWFRRDSRYRTIFPIPLGEAASWDPAAVERRRRHSGSRSKSCGRPLDLCADA